MANPTAAEHPQELAASRLFWLIGVFLGGLLLVVGLKAFFSHLDHELGHRSANERARLAIGEEVVRSINEIEKDVYMLATLTSEAAQVRRQEEIRSHVVKLNHDLRVLKFGGSVTQEIELNMEGRDRMTRVIHFQPPREGAGYVMELIEIAPLLDQVDLKVSELRALMAQRTALREKQDDQAYFEQEQRIALFLKHLPSHFLRLKENANRLFFDSSERLKALEQRLQLERGRYQNLENLLVVLVIVSVTVVGALFARNIRASNQRLRHAWEEMRAAKEEAERASRSKSDFVSRMSHELRTPMNAILGFAQLLEEEDLNPEQRDFVNEINRAGVHLLELINQVLDLAKIEAGSMTLEEIPFDLMKTMDEVATLVAEQARARGLSLRFYASPTLPSRVLGDPTRLRQVLINLMGNAVKFTHQGSIDLRVETVEAGERIQFSVRDTGIGMDAETLSRLFQPFAQADESTTRKYGGTGLGLMISRDLVRAMGGDIQVESQPGEGSLFRFSLPARPAPDAPPRPVPLAGYRALLTCSDEHQIQVLDAHLTALGAEVLPAYGPEAIQDALSGAPETPWVIIGRSACLAGLAGLRPAGSNPRDICLLIPEGAENGPLPPGVDGLLREPFTYSRLLDACTRTSQRLAPTLPAPDATSLPPPPPASHVLLVDDNRINQMVASRMLEKLGVTHEVADDGRQALDKLKAGRFDLVLMDMEMPELDGEAATRALREWEQSQDRPRLPVIAMTANALAEDREACLASGMDDYLAKPVEMDKLKALLDRWLGR
ncbi:MAG: ATP-binding protein [Pseudomonadota bacterium]